MKIILKIALLLLFPQWVTAQLISNKNYSYFDLMEIENKHFQHQLILSATADEIGWNGEWFRIKRNFFSLNFAASAKRLLPNIGNFWTPLSTEWQRLFPKNGVSAACKFRWFFNQRKFSFAGIKIHSGYYWTLNQEMPSAYSLNGPELTRHKVYWVNNFRYGFDLTAGRKFVNKLISEISVEAGYRIDRTAMAYQCVSYCYSGGNDPVFYRHEVNGIMHFQVMLGFDIFSR